MIDYQKNNSTTYYLLQSFSSKVYDQLIKHIYLLHQFHINLGVYIRWFIYYQTYMTTTVYAPVEINDATLKMNLYITMLTTKMGQQKLEKLVILATETFLKFMENQDFCKDSYDRVRHLAGQRNYFALLLLDQMIKNNKFAFKSAKRQIEYIFKCVWEKAWTQPQNTTKLQNLKLLVRVWGYIYGEKYEQNIRKWVQTTYKIKLTISAGDEAELKQLYGTTQQPKPDFKMEQLINNIQMQQKPKRNNNNQHNESLLEALGIDQL